MTSALGSRTWALLVLVLTSCSKPAPSASPAQDVGPGAIRLHLHTSFPVVPLGTAVDVTIALRDVEGDRASAPHALEVELSVEGGPRTTVEFQPGETEVDVSLTPTRAGILEIRAAGRELLPGSCFVKVTRPASARATPPRARGTASIHGQR